MHYVQINLGRNIGDVPMSPEFWVGFNRSSLRALEELVVDIEGPDTNCNGRIERHLGVGHWDQGEASEESVHYSVLIDVSKAKGPGEVAQAMTAFTRELRWLAESYGQEAIALITGSRLIKPKRK